WPARRRSPFREQCDCRICRFGIAGLCADCDWHLVVDLLERIRWLDDADVWSGASIPRIRRGLCRAVVAHRVVHGSPRLVSAHLNRLCGAFDVREMSPVTTEAGARLAAVPSSVAFHGEAGKPGALHLQIVIQRDKV